MEGLEGSQCGLKAGLSGVGWGHSSDISATVLVDDSWPLEDAVELPHVSSASMSTNCSYRERVMVALGRCLSCLGSEMSLMAIVHWLTGLRRLT